MLYQINNGSVSLGGETILSHVDFEIRGKEKIAIVGRNGAGKTTLLRLLMGEVNLDRDDKRMGPGIFKARALTVGILRQNGGFDPEERVMDMILRKCRAADPYSRERYEYEIEFDRLFMGLGFEREDKKRKLGSFSGGEQTRISLIVLLMEKPDLMLLDEPTNHLDMQATEWLEGYFRHYEKAVVFVSHDRFFLDQVVDVVWELEDGRLKRYPGNYTDYRARKRKDYEQQYKAWERQQAELKHLNELIEKFKHKPNKAAFARSRKSMISRMELIEKPKEAEAHIFTGSIEPEVYGSKWVLEAEHLKVGYDRALLELSLRVRRGQKIGIIGENGAGKTTLLKTVAGLLEPLDGSYSWGSHTVMGYFDQQSASITSEKSVLEHFRALYPALPEKEARLILGHYLFGGKEAGRRVTDLSGGEKSRLLLCELLAGRPNLLILDEPTNHMDIPARETLESAFGAYTGTMLFVSHDRYFIRQVADAILLLDERGVMYYPFGYEHYRKHCRRENGEDLSALVAAENQALVADLRAVPKGESHRLQEPGTEEAYVDWRLRHGQEPLEEALAAYEESLLWPDEAAWDLAEKHWTEACLAYYDLFLELGL